MDSVRAELRLLVKRPATWILLGVGILMGMLFIYVLPYYSYLNGTEPSGANISDRFTSGLAPLLPGQIVSSVLGGFPFYFGMFALILGVLTLGSEYGWGTLKTMLLQQPNRRRLLLAKLAALAAMLVLYTVTLFVAAAIASAVIALIESATVSWPSVFDVARALEAGWLILGLWAMLGVVLAVLSRGTAMAIGLGIIYGLVVEGLISGFGTTIPLLQDVAQGFLRTNGYSLIAPLRGTVAETGGPGAFSGPFVDPWQALAVIVAYLIAFGGLTAIVLQRRDVA